MDKPDDGMTPLEFYCFTIQKLGIPKRFNYDFKTGEWNAEGPFTIPSAAVLESAKQHYSSDKMA